MIATAEFGQYFLVSAFALLVGIGELSSRFRDSPVRLIRSPLAILYFGVNILS